ncbi:hypothetical protein NY2A_b604L [Paramecium bursaria Chlorella virus NY2A]|uniref:Uncharacterized protein b604L n=1 Tax=Paramecium bursaria Chlorella virus NY2A TaxID=46021 RepID=A7IXC9_PBCVN|nr:hypothetical protein NY2A_b604L [Paramecium bursaria Chlorella virus NY2A]YP_001498630.1 hypothetical protein AR158_c549L [Paramecium bursaria Chlorella virus AR158]ABT15003.1 hypothetical protein NY2A_b604L [Paramecium bursaria Chlorella virus NY2A]ABU44094.1 hypothetical protein AR158_c549L [Paramecium bursaria Chlorella virus AR158]
MARRADGNIGTWWIQSPGRRWMLWQTKRRNEAKDERITSWRKTLELWRNTFTNTQSRHQCSNVLRKKLNVWKIR